jgi:hypothetical protein
MAVRARNSELPSTAISIGGKVYSLCVDLGALALAEERFNGQGHQVDLLTAIPLLTTRAARLLEVFPCAIRTFHQELSFKAAQQLVTVRTYAGVVAGLASAWPATTKATEEANANLCFELPALAEAEEFFARQGHHQAGSLRDSVAAKPSLSAARRIFPCALHKFRPELSFTEAQRLMNLQSVYTVTSGLPAAYSAASQEVRQEFVDRLLAKRSWAAVAHA